MRTLTVYVVRHANDSPMKVLPTIKAAKQYLEELEADNDGDPLCVEWHTEARSFADNSKGAASMMSWLLGQCAGDILDGQEMARNLESSRGICNILSRALIHHGSDPDQIVLNASDADREEPELDPNDLAVGNPEHLH